MSNKTFNDTALEFMKLYYSCHPEKLPEDKEKAFGEMSELWNNYKNKLIEKGLKHNKDFFSDKF